MSVYCTLPRQDKCGLSRRKTWSNGERFLQNLPFNQNLDFERNHHEESQDNELQESDDQMSMVTSRNYRSEMCINELTEAAASQKLYYAVDSFDDLKALRRASVCSLSPDYKESSPNFYGEVDSAYESSNESLRLAKDVRKTSNKYFTLPTKFGRKLKKLNAQEAAKKGNCPSPDDKSHLIPEMKIPDNLDTRSAALTNTVQETEFHCCCRMGCHNENPAGYSRLNDKNRLHCCQQTLETVWEEPQHGHGYESQMMTVFENSLSSMSSKLHQLNLVNQQKDIEINQLRAHLETLSVNQNEPSSTSGWLKESVTKAFRRKSRLKPSETLIAGRFPNMGYGTAINYYGYSMTTTGNGMTDAEIVFKLEQQLQEKERMMAEMKRESFNFVNQTAALQETINDLRSQIAHLEQENQRLQEFATKCSYASSYL